jgi:hypothetical protein
MSSASDSYINTQVQSALLEVGEENLSTGFGEISDVATALIEALDDRGIELRPR